MRINLVNTIVDATVAGQVVTWEGPGVATDFLLYYSGENTDGNQTAFDDTVITGPLNVSHHGGANLGDLYHLNRPAALETFWEANAGWFYVVSVAGGAYEGVLPVPFHLRFDDNGLYVAPNERVQLIVPYIVDAVNLDNCSCTVSVVLREAITRYIPRVHDMTVDIGGLRKERLPEGTAVVILTEVKADANAVNPTNIAVLRGEHRLIYIDWDAMYAVWQTLTFCEAAPMNAGDIYLDFTDLGRHLGDALGTGQTIEFDGGGGTNPYLIMFTYSLDYHVPSRTVQSGTFVAGQIEEVRKRLQRERIAPQQIPIVLPEAQAVTPSPRVPGVAPRRSPGGYVGLTG